MLYVANAFSLQMVDLDCGHTIRVDPISEKRAQSYTWALSSDRYMSAVGHTDTAKVFEGILGIPITPNRISIRLDPEDVLLVGQVTGGRLPEGATTLPDGVTIRWVIITVDAE